MMYSNRKKNGRSKKEIFIREKFKKISGRLIKREKSFQQRRVKIGEIIEKKSQQSRYLTIQKLKSAKSKKKLLEEIEQKLIEDYDLEKQDRANCVLETKKILGDLRKNMYKENLSKYEWKKRRGRAKQEVSREKQSKLKEEEIGKQKAN